MPGKKEETRGNIFSGREETAEGRGLELIGHTLEGAIQKDPEKRRNKNKRGRDAWTSKIKHTRR